LKEGRKEDEASLWQKYATARKKEGKR